LKQLISSPQNPEEVADLIELTTGKRFKFVGNQKLCHILLEGCAFFPDASIDEQLGMIALPVGDRSVGNERAGCNSRSLDNLAFPRALFWSRN
jgi:hypothetical protein